MSVMTQQECQERINKVTDTITLFDYKSANESGMHCSVCGQDWIGVPQAVYSGTRGCPICCNQKIVVGYNDLWTTRPDVAELLLNPEDGYRYSYGSGKKVRFKCPDCGAISSPIQICSVSKVGFSCHNCSDGISIPNKFMSNILREVLDDNYESEMPFDWCRFKINGKDCHGLYDFYFKYYDDEYIVEMDGGLGHGKRYNYKKLNEIRDIDEEILRDQMKDKLAEEHGIKVIRIDAQYSDMDYLVKQILNSELSSILDLSNVDFEKAYQNCLKSMMIKVIDMYNNGLSSTQIHRKVKLSLPTVITYLKRGDECGLCEYKPRVSIPTPVICLNDGNEFSSIYKASKFYNIGKTRISNNCKGVTQGVSIKETGEVLIFKYV